MVPLAARMLVDGTDESCDRNACKVSAGNTLWLHQTSNTWYRHQCLYSSHSRSRAHHSCESRAELSHLKIKIKREDEQAVNRVLHKRHSICRCAVPIREDPRVLARFRVHLQGWHSRKQNALGQMRGGGSTIHATLPRPTNNTPTTATICAYPVFAFRLTA